MYTSSPVGAHMKKLISDPVDDDDDDDDDDDEAVGSGG